MIRVIIPQTILVVEDEAMIRMTAAQALGESGFTVLEAGDAADALSVLSRHPEIALLFTDINMPGKMDGLDLAIRAVSDRPDLRLIMSSGRDNFPGRSFPDDAKYLAKPYYMDALIRLVHQQLSSTSY